MSAVVVGIDEAGRGACLGPLVIAGVKIEKNKINDLVKIGVKDSKLLKPNQRKYLYPKIIDIALDYKIVYIQPQELQDNSITDIEIKNIAVMLEELYPFDIVIIDKIGGLSRENFLNRLKKFKKSFMDFEVIYAACADRGFCEVSAASVLAKVKRDNSIKALGYDNISGYPNKRTYNFIKDYILKRGEEPIGLRHRWRGIVEILSSNSFPLRST